MRTIAALAVLALALAGCDPQLAITGAHYQYVVDTLTLDDSHAPNNQIGNALAQLTAAHVALLPVANATAIIKGNVATLIDLQTPDLTNAIASDLELVAGAPADSPHSPVPAPCQDAEDCGSQLHGTGSFTIDPGANPATLLGDTRDGAFSGTADAATVQIATDTLLINLVALVLHDAHVTVSGITDERISTGAIAGWLALDDATALRDALHNTVTEAVLGCDGLVEPFPSCDCQATTVLQLFDTNHDCAITSDEFLANPAIVKLTTSDVAGDGVSFTLPFTAIHGGFSRSIPEF